jgi:hypothetical protein
MTDNMLRSLATEAVSLDREINEKTDRLKEIKAQLIGEAASRDVELTPTGGGGLRWTAIGNDGCIVRVNFPTPTLKSKIDEESSLLDRLKSVAGGAFTRLFVPAISYRLVEKFREHATALLPKADANRLVSLCQSVSAPRVSFETSEREAS